MINAITFSSTGSTIGTSSSTNTGVFVSPAVYTNTVPYYTTNTVTVDASDFGGVMNNIKIKETETETRKKEHTIEVEVGKANNEYGVPGIKRIHFNGNKCIVLWEDDDKTVVTCGEGEKFDRYTGFIAAVAKKMFGGTIRAQKLLNEKDADYQRKLAEEKTAKEKEKNRAEQEAKERKNHARRVRVRAEQYVIEIEADKLATELAKKRGLIEEE